MSALPERASVVVIGAGIVGNSMAYHLALAGWRDIVLIDKGTLPNPGGSTGHASNFIFPTDHCKEMTAFTLDSVRQYRELGVFTQSGGIEVARTPARMQELQRRMASSRSWGIESELLTPAQVKALVPFIDDSVILGGFHTPGVGVVDSLRAGTIMRERAQEMGALTIAAGVEVTGLDVENGRIRRVRTDQGTIEADVVVIACGVWSPRIARMAGASIPLTPAVHQMISVGPVPRFADTVGEIKFPIVRDMDTNMYERQHGGDLEVGSYAHRTIHIDPDDIPSIAASALSPTELPFTQEDFELQMEQALELVPEVLGDENVGHPPRDQRPAVAHAGRQPDHRRDAGGQGALVGRGDLDQGGARDRQDRGRVDDDRRARDRSARLRHRPLLRPPQDRAAHPRPDGGGLQQDLRHRPPDGAVGVEPDRSACRRSYERQQELGAVFFEAAGWERPYWYGANEPLLAEYGDRVMPRAGRVGGALVVADHQRRAPGHARSGGHGRPVGVRHLRRDRAGRLRLPRAPVRQQGRRCRPDGPSTRRCSTRPAGSWPTSRSCGSRTTGSGS